MCTRLSRRGRRRLWGCSLAAAVLAVLAALSPHPHLCPWFARLPWLARLLDREGRCPAPGRRRRPGGATAPPRASGDTAPLGGRLPLPDRAALSPVGLAELRRHDGSRQDEFPLWLAVDGVVLDVSGAEGRRFYAPGKDYSVFAGKDCTRALALGSLADEDLARCDVQACCADFDASQRHELAERITFYLEKYPAVGVLRWDDDIPPPS